MDHSSAPHSVPARTPEGRVETIAALRRLRMTGAENRYERLAPGELIHIDFKRLGRIGPNGPGYGSRHPQGTRSRGAGWELVHVCVDDATRLAYVEVLGDEDEDGDWIPAPGSRLLRRSPTARPRESTLPTA